MRLLRSKLKPRVTDRRGVAAVEAAIMLPLFVLIALGTIEACSMIFLKQTLQIGAYEGVRTALIQGSTDWDVQHHAQVILDGRGATGYTITVSPEPFQAQTYGTFLTVTVTAPCSSNSIFTPWFYGGRTITGSCTMMKEG
jgi:Flp pilus assembly protein TadG